MKQSLKKINRKKFLIQSAKTTGGLLLSSLSANLLSSCNGSSEKSPIIVGHQVDITGGFASWGYWIKKAAEAAVDEINRTGGMNGRTLKYVYEDTESNQTTGQRKFRKLAQEGADFIIGSAHSGVMMASTPLAKELKTIYLPIAMACEATCEKGNRYIFRLESEVCIQAKASAEWMVNNIAKKWTIIVADYAWGWSHEEAFSDDITKKKGQVLTKIRIPVGTKDFLPYLTQIPSDTEAIYFIFFGSDSINFIEQLHQSGYKKKKFTMICALEAIDVSKLGEAVEGMYLVEYFPRQLKYENTAYNKKIRSLVGVDNQGYEIGNKDRILAGSHYWAAFEHVYLVIQAMTKCNYASKSNDTKKLIETMESKNEIKASFEFPQGDKFLRSEDHQGFHRHWMSKIEKGEINVQFEIDLAKIQYDPMVDYRKEEI